MQIQIKRYRYTADACDGTLSINGLRICDTTESTKYMLPEGTYKVALRHHRASGRKVPVLYPMEGKSRSAKCGHILVGNGVYNVRDGRILVGSYLAPGRLVRSSDPFQLLLDRIHATLYRKRIVALTISKSE